MSNPYNQADIYSKYFGVKIGSNVRCTGKHIHFSEPYLVEIGNDVTIAANVQFVNHEGGVWLFRKEFPGINIYGKIVVGNNVFIGMNSIIMKDVNIGNNVIIGAGSIVTRDIPSDSVAVGCPAKVIKSVSDYKAKIIKKAVFLKSRSEKERKEEILNYINNS